MTDYIICECEMPTYSKLTLPNGFAADPCSTRYGECDQFCFVSPSNTKVCDCGPGYFLGSDNTSCTQRERLLQIY